MSKVDVLAVMDTTRGILRPTLSDRELAVMDEARAAVASLVADLKELSAECDGIEGLGSGVIANRLSRILSKFGATP